MARRKPRNVTATSESWRSGLEEKVSEQLAQAGVRFLYEPFRIPFTQPSKPRHYTPDWVLLDNGIVVESKGHFETKDRQKHLLIKEQYPDLDLRFVFSNPNTRIGKQSKTTYAAWATHKGFLYAKQTIPDAWLLESPNVRSLAVIQLLMEAK